MDTTTINNLAWAIARDGIAAHDAEVTAALRGGAGSVDLDMVRIVLDRSQPAIVRERAFGRLIATAETHVRAA